MRVFVRVCVCARARVRACVRERTCLRARIRDRYMYWNSQKLYFRLQIQADICVFLTGEVVSFGEVNKLVRLY